MRGSIRNAGFTGSSFFFVLLCFSFGGYFLCIRTQFIICWIFWGKENDGMDLGSWGRETAGIDSQTPSFSFLLFMWPVLDYHIYYDSFQYSTACTTAHGRHVLYLGNVCRTGIMHFSILYSKVIK